MVDKTEQELETAYHEVAALYDCADDLIATVEETYGDEKAAHFHLVHPLVDQIEESADMLSEEFINFADCTVKGKPIPTAGKARIEGALRKIYAAMDQYKERAKQSQQAYDRVLKLVKPVVERVQRQVERVVSVFVDFVELSLDRIMQKADLESLKQHETKIANMLHQMSMGGHHQST